jgi:hypothetical protein
MLVRLGFSKLSHKANKTRGSRGSSTKWTANDLVALRQLAGKEPLWRIAQILGRSELSVRCRAKKDAIPLRSHMS